MVGGSILGFMEAECEQQEQEVGFPYKRSPQVTSLYLATDRTPIMNHQGRNANMNFSEIRHDYIWGPAVENGANGGHDLLAAVSIDAWKSADDNEEGEVLANVLLTAHGDHDCRLSR